MPGPTGHLPSGAYCFGRFLGRKLSLAPPARDPIRANSFRLEARHSAGAPVLVAFGTVLPAAYAKGRGGRGAPFAGAHFVPSHRFLRPRFAGTCLRRAPSLFPWPRGATPPATFPFSRLLAPGTPETSGGGAAFLPSLILLPLSSPTRFVGRARKRISEACYTHRVGLPTGACA